jgi:hypothetical protein
VTAREISESRTRLGVVLLRQCALPELPRVKHRFDATTDPGKARRETIEWIKRLSDMCRLTETKAPCLFLPPKPLDFVGRAEALEELYAMLVEQDRALLYGEPGCGKPTLALKFAWQTQGAFDAAVFQLFNSVDNAPSPRSQRSLSWALRLVRPRSRLPPLQSGLANAGLCRCATNGENLCQTIRKLMSRCTKLGDW